MFHLSKYDETEYIKMGLSSHHSNFLSQEL